MLLRLLATIVLLSATTAARADAVLTFTFDQLVYQSAPTAYVQISATITNNESRNVTLYGADQALCGTICPYITGVGQDLLFPPAGTVLVPGESVTFEPVVFGIADAAPGSYTIFAPNYSNNSPYPSAYIEYDDGHTSHGIPSVLGASGGYPTLTVVAPTPEPSSFVLLGTGLLALAGPIRKRFV